MLKPSDFCVEIFNSVLQKCEAEIVALNIMQILKRTGDTWRPLSWEEYSEERKKDGSFTKREKVFYDMVIGYCENESLAKLFCPAWKKVYDQNVECVEINNDEISCKHCKSKDVCWDMTDKGWRLFDVGTWTQHLC